MSPDCRRLRPFLVVAMLLGFSTVASAQSVPYLKAIAAYWIGDLNAAADALGAMDERQVWNEANRFGQEPMEKAPVWLPRARVAALMHTELWFAGGVPEADTPRQPHYLAARAVIRAIDRLRVEDGPIRGDPIFVRDWYLLVTSHLHGHAVVGRSRALLAEARKMFPADADLLLASGADHEMVSVVATGYLDRYDHRGVRVGSDRVSVEREVESAVRFYRESLKVQPALVEARLRLGHVLHRQGQVEAATTELENARLQAEPAVLRYLADIFLAMIETERGHGARAAELYKEALKLFPFSQAPQLGLSELAYLEGRSSDAAAIVTKLLKQSEKDDPWWLYSSGEFWHLKHRLSLLQKRLRQ